MHALVVMWALEHRLEGEGVKRDRLRGRPTAVAIAMMLVTEINYRNLTNNKSPCFNTTPERVTLKVLKKSEGLK